MYLKHTETLFLLGCTAFLSLYIEADIISSSLSGSTQTIVEAFSQESKLPSQVTLDHTIEPTRAHEAKETVLIVGAGAGGAAAAVKLPLVSDAQPGVEQAAGAEQHAEFVPTSSAESAEISQTDTVPEVVAPVPAGSSAPSDGESGRLDTESTPSSHSQPTQQQQAGEDTATTASSGQGTVADEQAKILSPAAETDGQGDQNVVQMNVVPSLSSATDGGGRGELAESSSGDDLKLADGGVAAGEESLQDNSDSTQPEVKVDPTVPDLSQGSQTIDPNMIGNGEKPSNLPTGVGGMAVEPEFNTEAKTDEQPRSSENQNSAPADGQQQAGSAEEEGDFPTFDKWSAQYLAEQEKQKIEKEQEQAVKPGAQLTQKKLRQNFAAESCGAKIVSSNAEAENANFLLNGNPDEYMISPCKAKKWFVVELCEPVQIHKVEMGTLELFSSPPKSFRVASSQRFPTKDWTLIGQFEMTPDRSIQPFHTQVREEFVKFLRVEMLEHHGKEHYCPLTTLRVLGIDMALDDDEDSGETDGHESEHSDGDGEVGDAMSLFNSAKETVVKLVQKVLYTGDKEEPAEEADNATKVTEKEGSEDQETTPCPIKEADKTTTDTPETTVLSPPTDSTEKPDTSQTPQKQEQQPLVEDVTTTETPIITKLGDTEQLPLAETPVVVKLEPEEEDEHSRPRSRVAGRPVKLTTACPNSPLRNFYTPVAEATDTVRSSPICQQMAREAEGKVRIRPFSDSRGPAREDQVNSQSTDAADRERESAKSVSVEGTQLESMDGATSVPVPASVAQTEIVSDSLKPEDYHSTPPAVQLTDVEAHTEPSDSGQTSSDDALHHQATDHTPTPTLSTNAAVELTDQAQSAAATTLASGTESAPQLSTEPALEPSLASDPASLGLGASPVSSATSTPTLDMSQSPILQQPAPDISETIFLKVDPSPTTDDRVSADHVVSMTQLPSAVTTETPVQDGRAEAPSPHSVAAKNQIQTPSEGTVTAPQTGQGVNATESEPVISQARQGRIPDLVKVGMPSSKRDASIMKLNNRIVALEQNVSMTKKYLEELSRAFKQQNEEMMKLMNKTEGRMAGLVARSDERDLLQQTAIAVLDQKVANLTQVIDLMQLKMDTMANELWRGQILLGILQALAFLWLFTNTATSAFTRTSGSRLHTPPASATCSRASSLYVSPSDLPKGQSEEERKSGVSDVVVQRRNSDGGLQQQQQQQLMLDDQGIMKKLSSESNLSKIASSTEESAKDIFSQNSKKKKKKKQRQSQMMLDAGGAAVSSPGSLLSESTSSTPAQSPSFSSSAGVLFGATGLTVSPSNAQVADSLECAIPPPPPSTAAAALSVMPTHTFGEMKENSPVGDAGLSLAVWPGLHGCRMCENLLASRTSQQRLPDTWAFRFPSAGLSQGLYQSHLMAQCGHPQCPHSVAMAGPHFMSAGMPGHGQAGLGSTSPCQPFLDLSNSLHQTGVPGVLQQSPPPRVSESHQMASPEFKLPAYRRSKIRRVSESSETDPSGGNLGQNDTHRLQNQRPYSGSSARKTLVVTDSRRRKSDFINPKPWEEFFLAKNYLSENRFKFPVSPPRTGVSPSSSDLPENEALTSSPGLFKTDQEGSSSPAILETNFKPSSPASADQRSDSVCSARFHPSTPSFIPLQQHSVDDVSRSSSPPSFLSLQTSLQVEKPSAQAQMSESCGERRRNTLPVGPVQQNEQDATSISGCSARGGAGGSNSAGGKKQLTVPQKTHRRQGSYPLDQTNTTKYNANKPSQPVQGSGSAQPHGSKTERVPSSGQPGSQQASQHSHHHQGWSKFKKIPSNPALSGHSRKGAGIRPSVSHVATSAGGKVRHVGGATAIRETPVTVD